MRIHANDCITYPFLTKLVGARNDMEKRKNFWRKWLNDKCENEMTIFDNETELRTRIANLEKENKQLKIDIATSVLKTIELQKENKILKREFEMYHGKDDD